MNRINFIGIGTGKSATSWLANILVMHPQVDYPTTKKEIHYFNKWIPLDYKTENHFHRKDYKWYHSHFDFLSDYLTRGEITPCYLDMPGTSYLIHKYNPDIKLLVILRNPWERLISQFEFARSNGIEKHSKIEDAVKHNPTKYIESNLYYKHLTDYLYLFDKENILILFYEDLKQD
jgi:hypothetical protein